MCGIVGYIGKNQALPILLEGIKLLEYRGYDSAGIAIVNNGHGVISKKAVGKVANLEKKIKENESAFAGQVGIVHSRWATHGGVSEKNAHPHTDCLNDLWVVHNGIIENYKTLKADLEARGHRFRSETDTEIAAHIIEEIRKENPGITLPEAVRLATQKIQGAYALLVMSRTNPDMLIAVRKVSPLLLGVGEGELFAASDASALLAHTRNVIYLNDGEVATLDFSNYTIVDSENKTQKKIPQRLDWDVEQVQRGGFEHFMLKEMLEQPASIENSIRGRLAPKEGNAKLGGLTSVEKKLEKVKRIHIVGCGTAYLAGKVGEYMFEDITGISAKAELASEFRYRNPKFEKGDLLLGISQSGETADTLAAIQTGKDNAIMSLGLVNVVGSTIARETDAGVYQHIGPEIGVASTKAFTSQVTILSLFAVYLARLKGMSESEGRKIIEEVKKLPDLVKKTLELNKAMQVLARKYHHARNFLYLGRKYNLPVAFEGALKLKEISYIHAEGMSAGEMKHGPIAMIDEEFPTWLIAPKDSVYEKNISNLQEIKARRGPVIVVTTEGNTELEKMADDVIYIPETLEMLTPILAVIPSQLFAYHVAELKGLDIDKPRNLAKSVTVE